MLEKMQFIANTATRNQQECWEDYRTSLTNFIDCQTKKMGIKPKRILVLGAGNGNDLPLSYLEMVSEEIVLVDIDPTALDYLLKRVTNADKYKPFIIDLSGLVNELKNSNIYAWPVEDKIRFIAALNPKPNLGKIQGNFDLVLSSNYSTQLVAPYFLWTRGKSNSLPGELAEAVKDLTGKIMREIFQQIYNILNPGGALIHLTDFLELKWNKDNGQASPTVKPVCGSELTKYEDLFALKDTTVFRWDFFKNQEEKIIFLVLANIFQKLKN